VKPAVEVQATGRRAAPALVASRLGGAGERRRAVETVRLPEPSELGPEDQKIFENTRQWFRIDFVPKMSRALRAIPAIGDGITRASRRAMPDRVLSRAQKELIAAAVSAMNVCEY
jgi:hypothetical protein